MATEAEIQKRIAEEQAKIDVPSYQDAAFDGAWKSRSRMIWGLAMVGAIAGAVIGAVALIAPAIFAGLAVDAALVAKSMIVFSATGLSSGWAVGALAGFPAGAAASTMKEYERRALAREVEQKIRENPEATVTLAEKDPIQRKEDWSVSGFYNWKSGLLLASMGAIGGSIFAAALSYGGTALAPYTMQAMDFLLGESLKEMGKAAAANVITAYTIGLGAAGGALFGTNIPRIGRMAGNFMGGILSGQSIGAPWPKAANLPEPKPVLVPVVVQPEQEIAAEIQTPKFADKVVRTESFEALIVQSAKDAECGCPTRA